MVRFGVLFGLLVIAACAPVPQRLQYADYFDMCKAKIGNVHGAFETCTTFAFNATR